MKTSFFNARVHAHFELCFYIAGDGIAQTNRSTKASTSLFTLNLCESCGREVTKGYFTLHFLSRDMDQQTGKPTVAYLILP